MGHHSCTWFTGHRHRCAPSGGGLGLTAEAHARRRKANWLGKERILNPGCAAYFNGMTRRASGRIRWPPGRVARGAGPVQLPSGGIIHSEFPGSRLGGRSQRVNRLLPGNVPNQLEITWPVPGPHHPARSYF